ncbi:hypothetical protein CcrJ4_gp110 [Caulobacter phage J4]|nr:hypothetical protein CcrJ4_gp110 [Caulobacter phage J4]
MDAAPVAFNAPAAAVATPAPTEIFDAGKEAEAPVIATESKPAVRRGRPSKAQLEAEAAAAAGDE